MALWLMVMRVGYLLIALNDPRDRLAGLTVGDVLSRLTISWRRASVETRLKQKASRTDTMENKIARFGHQREIHRSPYYKPTGPIG
jgi:hypothetical protein